MKVKLIVELASERREKLIELGPEFDGKTEDELVNDDEIDGMLLEHVWDHVCSYIEIAENANADMD